MAEREGFEPSKRFPVYTLSKRAPSTTRPPLLFKIINCFYKFFDELFICRKFILHHIFLNFFVTLLNMIKSSKKIEKITLGNKDTFLFGFKNIQNIKFTLGDL